MTRAERPGRITSNGSQAKSQRRRESAPKRSGRSFASARQCPGLRTGKFHRFRCAEDPTEKDHSGKSKWPFAVIARRSPQANPTGLISTALPGLLARQSGSLDRLGLVSVGVSFSSNNGN